MARLKKNTPKYFLSSFKLLLLAFLTIFCILTGKAQVITELKSGFSKWQEGNYREKVFLHVNKNIFVAGEICWFKTYCVEGYTNKLHDFSKIAYVEILDKKNITVLQAKINLINGCGSGSFYIPNNIASGNYKVRAYTNWMKNFSAELFFDTDITIINTTKSIVNDEKTVNAQVDIQFFPEGGHLVAGLTNKIAFKITGTDGRGLQGKGYILNQHNDTVVTFNTLKFGIGSFQFKPIWGESYHAVIATGNSILNPNLPEIKESGLTLNSVASVNGWNVKIQQDKNITDAEYYVLVHNNRLIEFVETTKINNGGANFFIDKDKVNDGLNYISVFNTEGKPIIERLIFKRPDKKLKIETNLDSSRYLSRNKVNLEIKTTNKFNNPIGGNLSVSVFRVDSIRDGGGCHIDNYLWLGSELKGNIESPDYYLGTDNQEANDALDNLMLAQGWTQFNWDEIQHVKKNSLRYLPEHNGHIVTGNISLSTNKNPSVNTLVFLSIPGPHPQLFSTKSDSSGFLQFFTSDFFGQNEIFFQASDPDESNYHLEIASPFADQFSSKRVLPFILNSSWLNNLNTRSINMQVENIFNGQEFKQFYNSRKDSLPFYQTPGKSYLLDNYTRFTTVEEVLREYVSSIVITKHQGKFNIKMFNGENLLPGKPTILLDGVPVFDPDKLFSMDPLKIKKLDVVTSNYLLGPAIFNGILSFATYKGDLSGFELDPKTLILDYDGLQLERKFYSPVYDTETAYKSSIPDFRTSLYWNPSVNTDSEGKINLSFYTGDKPGKYTGVIEGISADGIGYQTFQFEIKN